MQPLIRSLFISVAFLCGVLAQAAPDSEKIKATLEAQPGCANFVRYDEQNVYLGFGSYRRGFEEPRLPNPSVIRVAPLDGGESFELATKDAAIDVVTDGGTAYVLTYSSLEEWDLAKRERVTEHATYAIHGPLAYKEHAEAMARHGDKLIFAHGRLGVSFFNMHTKRLVNQFRLIPQQRPLESMATGVTVQGDRAYVVMDNFHLTRPGDGVKIFRGLVVIDPKSESVVSELGGLDPGAESVVADANRLIVSFGGVVWKYDVAPLATARGSMPEPKKRIWHFPKQGNLAGHAAMDDKYYYTCLSRSASGSGGVHVKVPVALDRREFSLE